MVDKKVVTIGTLILTLLITGIIYVQLGDKVKIRVDNDKTTFYTQENNRWVTSGREYNTLLDGTSKLYRDVSEVRVNHSVSGNFVTITRYTPYKRGPTIIDTYTFTGNSSSELLFPITHTIRILNAEGYFYKYEVKDLVYTGDTFKLDGVQTKQSFGRNMKVEWWKDYRLGWIYKNGNMYIKSEKILVPDITFSARLFDPPSTSNNLTIYQNGQFSERKYELGTTANITITTNSTKDFKLCIDIDDPNFGVNTTCVDNLNLSIDYSQLNLSINELNDGSTNNNLSSYFYNSSFAESFNLEIPYSTASNITKYYYTLTGYPTNYIETADINQLGIQSRDHDWTTYALFSTNKSSSYTLNTQFGGGYMQIKHLFGASGNTPTRENLTLPITCKNVDDTLNITYEFSNAPVPLRNNITIFCNGTTQIAKYDDGGVCVGGCTSRIFEVGIWLNNTYSLKQYPLDIGVDLFGEGTTDAIFPGKLNGSRTFIRNFSNGLTSENLSFTSAGGIVRYVNLSTHNPILINDYNFVLSVGGYTIDNETIDFTNNFYNDSFIFNYSGSLPSYVYDDYSGWTDTRWSGDYTIIQHEYVQNIGSASGGGTCTIDSSGWTTSFEEQSMQTTTDISNSEQTTFGYQLYTNANCQSPSCIQNNEGRGVGRIRIIDEDGNTVYSVRSSQSVCSATSSPDQDFESINSNSQISFRSDGFIYVDGIKKVSYFDNKEYYLSAYSYGSGTGTGGAGYGRARIEDINLSGFTSKYGANLTFDNSSTTELFTQQIHKTGDIFRATITTTKRNTDNGKETLYLSNDNGTSWELTQSGISHSFATTDNTLKARIVLDVTNNATPFIIDSYSLSVVPGAVSNISIDIGNDGKVDYQYNDTLNESNSPRNLSLIPNSSIDYLASSSCTDKLTCLVPILFEVGSAGLLEIQGLSLGQNTSDIEFNNKEIDDYLYANCTTNCNISNEVSTTPYYFGTIGISNPLISYLGDGSVNLTARLYNSSYWLFSSVSRLIHWRHSPFEANYPVGVEYYDVFPSSYNAKNVEPYGQKSGVGIFNISTTAKTDPVNVSVCINDYLDTCLNVVWSINYNKTPNQNINSTGGCSTTIDAVTDLKNTSYQNVYNWWNLTSCTTTAFEFLQYNLTFDSLCSDCVKVN